MKLKIINGQKFKIKTLNWVVCLIEGFDLCANKYCKSPIIIKLELVTYHVARGVQILNQLRGNEKVITLVPSQLTSIPFIKLQL